MLHDLNNWSIYPTVISFYHFLLLGVPPDSERWSKSFQVIGFVENWLGCCCWQADWSSSKYCCIRRKQMLQKRQIQSKQGVRLWLWFHILIKAPGSPLSNTFFTLIKINKIWVFSLEIERYLWPQKWPFLGIYCLTTFFWGGFFDDIFLTNCS